MQLENIIPAPAPQSPLFQDLTGNIYSRLTVKFYAGKAKTGHSLWACECACGRATVVLAKSLKAGLTQSCGCLIVETLKKNVTIHGHTSNRSRTPEHQAYTDMVQRCTNPKCKAYKDYGGRGISVFPAWLGENGFINFLHHVGARPNPKFSLERINNNGNYEPGNVRWATRKEQGQNRRTTRFITAFNETHSMKAWSEKLGINYNTFQQRIRKGETVEEIAEHPPIPRSCVRVKNILKSSPPVPNYLLFD